MSDLPEGTDPAVAAEVEALIEEMIACGCSTRISDIPGQEFRFTEGRPACGNAKHVWFYDFVGTVSGQGPGAN